MEYKTLREMVQNHPKYEGCVEVDRAPLINDGFPGTFNLSFTEYHWLREYGKLVDFTHDFVFSTIQSCIRPEDVQLTETQNSWKYLGIFEMSDLTGAIALKKRFSDEIIHSKQISDFVKFLKGLGVPEERIYPSYCTGGSVRDLTGGKYCFNYNIPKDEISRKAFLEAGIPEENLIGDRTRDTFLSVNLRKEEQSGGVSLAYNGWGYRNELNILMRNKKLLDVGTLERFAWTPDWQGEQIIGLNDTDCGFSILALGLERLCMVTNGLSRIQDVDYIAPFYERMRKTVGEENLMAAESLRALHRIYSDIDKFSIDDIGRHRKARINKMIKNIPESFSLDSLNELLKVHSETQPWYPELQEGIEPTIERIEMYRASKKK